MDDLCITVKRTHLLPELVRTIAHCHRPIRPYLEPDLERPVTQTGQPRCRYPQVFSCVIVQTFRRQVRIVSAVKIGNYKIVSGRSPEIAGQQEIQV